MNKLFTIVTSEWDGVRGSCEVERLVRAKSESTARKRFIRWWKKHRTSQPDIVHVYQPYVIDIRPRKKTK